MNSFAWDEGEKLHGVKTMIYANLQSNPNSTINLLVISIWPGREMVQNPVWGKEVGCKGWSSSWGLNAQCSRAKESVCMGNRDALLSGHWQARISHCERVEVRLGCMFSQC